MEDTDAEVRVLEPYQHEMQIVDEETSEMCKLFVQAYWAAEEKLLALRKAEKSQWTNAEDVLQLSSEEDRGKPSKLFEQVRLSNKQLGEVANKLLSDAEDVGGHLRVLAVANRSSSAEKHGRARNVTEIQRLETLLKRSDDLRVELIKEVGEDAYEKASSIVVEETPILPLKTANREVEKFLAHRAFEKLMRRGH
jgi:hypothetical protein